MLGIDSLSGVITQTNVINSDLLKVLGKLDSSTCVTSKTLVQLNGNTYVTSKSLMQLNDNTNTMAKALDTLNTVLVHFNNNLVELRVVGIAIIIILIANIIARAMNK